MQYVRIGHSRNCIVSYSARVAETDPPGLLMYMWMSALLFSYWRYRSFWVVRLARKSVMTGDPPVPGLLPTNTIRFSSSRSSRGSVRCREYGPRGERGWTGPAIAGGSNGGSMGSPFWEGERGASAPEWTGTY